MLGGWGGEEHWREGSKATQGAEEDTAMQGSEKDTAMQGSEEDKLSRVMTVGKPHLL